MLNPVINTLSFSRLCVNLKRQSVVECRFPQVDDVVDVIAAYPQVSCLSCEVSSGRVNYSGRLILTVAYSDEEGKLCRIQRGVEFSHYADDAALAPAQTGLCNLACERTQVKREGSALVVSCVVGANIDVYANGEAEYVSSCEGAFTKIENKNIFTAVTFSGASEIEDEFEADSVVDILIAGAQPVITSCECGTGEVVVTGEIYLSLFAMRQSMPVCLDRNIPFKACVPCDDAVAGMPASAAAEIRDLNVTATVNEERGKCGVNVSCDLAVNGVFYSAVTVEAVTDAFACDNRLNLSYEEQAAYPCEGIKVYAERVSGLAASKSKLDYTCLFRAVVLPRAEFNPINSGGAVEGSVTAVLIYEQGGEIKSSEINLPFSVSPEVLVGEGRIAQISVAVCGVNVKQPREGEIEAEASLKISAVTSLTERCIYISTISEGEAIVPNDSAISVFIPSEGDGLWDISKKLMQPPETVAQCNPDLNYPLSGRERILIFRRKS